MERKARSAEERSHEQLLNSTTVSLFPESTPLDLTNMRWKINFTDEYSECGKTNFHLYIVQLRENKLRQFSFKLLHGILVTKNELFKFRLADDKSCFFCLNLDSIEHTLSGCTVTQSSHSETSIWFNRINTTDILLKQFIYAYEYFEKKPTLKECQSKVLLQWQIE